MRVATYTRISTDEEHQPYSLEAQATRLDSYAASQGDWELVRRFSDQTSGAKLERPGLQRAMLEAKAKRFDLLLVYRVDRLSRSVRGLAHVLEELDAYGVAFRSATEPFDTGTPAGRMMVQMLGVFAEFERATIIDRVIAGMERKAARGGWCGGQRPFGYAVDRERDCLVVKDDEAPLIPVIFRLYTEDRLGANAIAACLNERGHRTRQGRPWSHMSVLTVLRNRAYVGEIFFRGVHRKASHPGLVDPDLFERAQAILVERGENRGKRRSNPSPYLLSGLLRCGFCHRHYVGAAANGRSARYTYYVCFSRQRYGRQACEAERLPADDLHEAILDALERTYSDGELVEEAFRQAVARLKAGKPSLADELDAAEAEIGRMELALDRYLTAFESGSLSEAACGQRVKSLSEKLMELRCRRDDLHDLANEERAAQPIEPDLEDLAGRLHDVLREGDDRGRKALLKALVHEVRVVGRRDIRPTFRLPSDPVRILDGLVGPAVQNPNRDVLIEGPRIVLRRRGDR